jgi:hypothetical protein
MQIPEAAAGGSSALQILTFIFSGSTLAIGFRLVFQAGKLVEKVENNERRLTVLEEKLESN